MKMKIFIFFILCYSLENSSCYSEIDELCTTETYVGRCKPISKCPTALKMVSEDSEDPPICFHEEGPPSPHTIIVCCPLNESTVVTGPPEMRIFFNSSRVRKTNEMTCWYEDREPFLCCKNFKHQATSDPPGCPPLPSPKLSAAVEHPAWTKCVEYQRYYYVCIADPKNNMRLIRKPTYVSAPRITHGELTEPKQFPHMAVIGSPASGENGDIDIEWLGGGSLISDKFILTAAHVIVQTQTVVPRYALLGSIDKTNLKDGLLYNIIRRIPHPEYTPLSKNKKHDIAVVELHERVLFNEFIRPACLPVQGVTLKNKYMIAGWGKTEQGIYSATLRMAHVTESPRSCNFIEFDEERMICAVGKYHRFADSCQGDSGGPLMAVISNLQLSYSVEGIVSYGASCTGTGVYTRVDKYMDFIMNIVWKKEWEDYKKLVDTM